jgi:hypothetical protein
MPFWLSIATTVPTSPFFGAKAGRFALGPIRTARRRGGGLFALRQRATSSRHAWRPRCNPARWQAGAWLLPSQARRLRDHANFRGNAPAAAHEGCAGVTIGIAFVTIDIGVTGRINDRRLLTMGSRTVYFGICSREIPDKGLRNRWADRQRGNPLNLTRLAPA